LRQFALSQLIQEELLRQKARNLNMRIPEDLIEREMVQFDAFRGEDGRFDREIFTQRLRQQGMSANDFRAQLREDLLNQQLLGSLAASEFVLSPELEEFQRLVGQKRDYRYVVVKASDYRDQVNISPADIETFYQQESERFMTPERVKVDYLIFDPSELTETLEVTQKELREEYQRFVEAQEGEGTYSAAHILLTFDNADEQQQARETLQKARQDILDGASFAELARDLSEDAATARKGGDLGPIQQGSLDSAFEEALFALDEVGDLSGIVETDFGLHLIQLTDLEQAEVPAYEEVKEELRERLLAQPLRAATSDMLEQLNNLSFSSDDLSQVASATELEMQTSTWLNASDLEGFWAEPEVSAALFSEDVIEDSWITEPLRLEDGRYLVLAKNEYQPRQPQPLEEVTAEVRNELAAAEARKLAQEEANRLQEKLLSGTDPGISWKNVEGLTRNNRSVDPAINQAAFALNLEVEPAVRTVSLRSGHVALVQLLAVEPGEVSESEDEIRQLRRMLVEDQGRRLQSEFVNHLERQAEIDIRQ